MGSRERAAGASHAQGGARRSRSLAWSPSAAKEIPLRRVSAIGIALAVLVLATRLGDAFVPQRVAPVVRAASSAAAPARDVRDVRAGSQRSRVAPRFDAELVGRVSASLRERALARSPEQRRAAPKIGATRLALLERGEVLRRVGAPQRSAAGVEHTRFEVSKRGLPFLDRGGRIHERDGRPIGVSGRVGFPPLALRPRGIDRSQAIALAQSAAGAPLLRATPQTRLGWVGQGGHSVLAYEVTLPSRAPLAAYRVWLDAADGALLGLVDRLQRFETGTGVVYADNPVDAKSPTEQDLHELDGGGRLIGRVVSVFDVSATEAFRPDLHFEFPTGDPRFVQTSVYRGLTETGLLAEQHGLAIGADVPTFTGQKDPFSGGPWNNAAYDPSIPAFFFGDGDGVVLRNLGTDIDVPAHEYGHHVFELLATPLVFSTQDPVLAMTEGVADTFSLLVGGDAQVGNSVVPGERGLRSLSVGATFPDFFHPDPHVTGLVYGGVSLDLVKKLGEGPFADLLIEALPFLPLDPIETDYREAFLDGDAAMSGGLNRVLIEKVFQKRGFDTLELPPEFEGQLIEGMAEMRVLPNNDFDVWVFSELPPSGQLQFQTTGTGDVDLFVLPVDFDQFTPFLFSETIGSSNESILLTSFSFPLAIDDADAWFVFVFDAPGGGDSSYTLTATTTPHSDGISIGGATSFGAITDPDEQIDWYQFQGTAGQHVRVALSGTSGLIDPFVAVLTREPFEVLATDDDSGGGSFGLDALLQGVELPVTGKYVIAVLSLTSDFNPFVGAGGYALALSLCNNSGADTDGDGAADVCDQDDDDDGFVDSQDLDPLDPNVCIDFDDDGCNDCANGSFDFRDDGPDSDLDVVCDLGDDDDDNDGCSDDVDPAPTTPSEDDDLDFLGLDCDNCAEVPNPLQEDADAAADGDACSVCARVDWAEPPSSPPDQNPAGAALRVSVKGQAASVRASGAFNPALGAPIDPAASGVQLRLADSEGALLDVFVPGVGGGVCDSADGWTQKGASFSYANRSGALPPGCGPGSAQGLSSLRVTDDRAGKSGAVLYDLRGKGVPLPQGLARPARFLHFALALGEPPAPGLPSAAGAAGVCAESVLRVGAATSNCRVSEKDGAVSSVRCKPD